MMLALEKGKRTYDNMPWQKDDERDITQYHAWLLVNAGLAVGKELPGAPTKAHLDALTWEGHEFLNAARSDSNWNKATEMVTKEAGGLPFGVLKAVLTQLIVSAIMPDSTP